MEKDEEHDKEQQGVVVSESWSPSPGPKQFTLAASFQKMGLESKIVKVSSPGAKPQPSLKDIFMAKVEKELAEKRSWRSW